MKKAANQRLEATPHKLRRFGITPGASSLSPTLAFEADMARKDTRVKVDAVMSAIIGSFLAINMMMGSGAVLLVLHNPYPLWLKALGLIFFTWSVITESWFLATAWTTILRQQQPFAVALSLHQPRLPTLIRPIAFIWWLFHFLMILVWSMVLTVFEKDMPMWAWTIVAVFVSGFAYLTFAYLLLALTTFTKEQHIIARVWGWRGWWAIAHGLIVLATKAFIAPHVNINN